MRISTVEQDLELQIDALEKAGCEKIFSDTASGAKDDRKGLSEAMEFSRSSDSIVVWKFNPARQKPQTFDRDNQFTARTEGRFCLSSGKY